jgi:hypothetical protein
MHNDLLLRQGRDCTDNIPCLAIIASTIVSFCNEFVSTQKSLRTTTSGRASVNVLVREMLQTPASLSSSAASSQKTPTAAQLSAVPPSGSRSLGVGATLASVTTDVVDGIQLRWEDAQLVEHAPADVRIAATTVPVALKWHRYTMNSATGMGDGDALHDSVKLAIEVDDNDDFLSKDQSSGGAPLSDFSAILARDMSWATWAAGAAREGGMEKVVRMRRVEPPRPSLHPSFRSLGMWCTSYGDLMSHLPPRAYRLSTQLRHDALRAAGWRVLRISPQRIAEELPPTSSHAVPHRSLVAAFFIREIRRQLGSELQFH